MIHPQAHEFFREIRLTHAQTPKASALLDRSIFLWSCYDVGDKAAWLSAVSSHLNACVQARIEPEPEDVEMLSCIFTEWEALCV